MEEVDRVVGSILQQDQKIEEASEKDFDPSTFTADHARTIMRMGYITILFGKD